MAKITIVLGGLLTILGVLGFVLTGSEHYTALIPSAFGIVFVILGGLALNDNLRKHAMHLAAVFGVLGCAGTIPGVVKMVKWSLGTEPARPAAVVAQSLMCLIMLAFVILCVQSFIHARRNRESQGFPVNPVS